MKTNDKKWNSGWLWVIASVFVIASCNTENMDVLESELKQGHEIELQRGPAGDNPAAQNRLLADIRRATAKYHDFEVAQADGFVLDLHCAAHPEYGGMGFHAVNFARVMNGEVNPVEPEVLVYEPMENGKLRLVAVEYIVVAEIWDALYDYPPMLGSQEFDDHRAPGSGGPPFPHYQLHVWVWRNNPNGMYSPFNPMVSCDFAYLFEDLD